MEETIAEEKTYTPAGWMIRGAKFLSVVLTPMIIPFMAFVCLIYGTQLRYMFPPITLFPLVGSPILLILLGIICCFTIVLPSLTIFLYKTMHRLSWDDLLLRRIRFVPYAVTIISYGFCLALIHRIARHVVYGYLMSGIILSVLICLIICFLVNLKWKISVHMAGIGGATGMLVAISLFFGQNQTLALCGLILLAGFLGTSRILLGRHTFYEVIFGYLTGLLTAMLVLRIPSLAFFTFYMEKLF
ncbi:MAG: hypothetical protein LUF85_11020 [Bacteroides sp.]|nr:hypothetical protein [Bacteroides sp.]